MTTTLHVILPTIPQVLTVAASDPSGAAGMQADLKTFEARQVYGMSAITAVTVQNSQQVSAVQMMGPEFVAQQIKVLLADFQVSAIKTGLLLNAEIIEAVSQSIGEEFRNLIVDPVLVNGTGVRMTDDATIGAYKRLLFPRALIVTPNLDEASILAEREITSEAAMVEAAKAIHALGPHYVLIKGGHLGGNGTLIDLLYDGVTFHEFTTVRLPVNNPRGVGCTLASCIAAEVAKGQAIIEAVGIAKAYIAEALKGASTWRLGHGNRGVLFHSVGHSPIMS